MHRLAAIAAIALLAAPAGGVSPDPASLAVPAEQSARARGLIGRLGSEAFQDRDRATRELETMGRLAAAALTEARDHPDPEVRMRVALLLPRAEADDLQARVAAFLTDVNEKYAHDLPGWQRFRALAGDDPSTRALFVEVVKNQENHELLLALRGVPAEEAAAAGALAGGATAAAAGRRTSADLAQAVVARRRQLQYRLTPPYQVVGTGFQSRLPDLPDVALLLLAESLVSESALPRAGHQYQVSQVFHLPAGQEAARGGGKYGPAFHRLAVRWLDTRDGLPGLINAVQLARTINLGDKAAARYAARLLTSPVAQPWNKASAAAMLVHYRGTEYALHLTGLFEDATFLMRGGPGGPNPDVLVRDAALAAALLLTNQDPKAYGFEPNPLVKQPGVQFSYSHFRFRSDAAGDASGKRAKALAKWKEWELGQVGSVVGTAGAVRLIAVQFPERDPAAAQAEERKNAAAAGEP